MLTGTKLTGDVAPSGTTWLQRKAHTRPDTVLDVLRRIHWDTWFSVVMVEILIVAYPSIKYAHPASLAAVLGFMSGVTFLMLCGDVADR